MDLLGYVRQKSGDEGYPHQKRAFKDEGRHAQAVLLGGHVRVGLEDNLYLDRGQLATNGQLVDRARKILENMNVSVMGPADVRAKLKLTKHS